jgi:hypothetical protein
LLNWVAQSPFSATQLLSFGYPTDKFKRWLETVWIVIRRIQSKFENKAMHIVHERGWDSIRNATILLSNYFSKSNEHAERLTGLIVRYMPTILDKNHLRHSIKTFLCDFFYQIDRNNLLVCPPPPPETMLDVLTVFYECNQHWLVGVRGRFSKFAIIIRNFVR